MKHWWGLALLILFAGAAPVVAEDGQKKKPMEQEIIDGDVMYTVIPPGEIPAIDDPVLVSVAEAASWMKDHELVIGVVGANGETRAYSTWQLDHHEIVNDTLGEKPIAVVW